MTALGPGPRPSQAPLPRAFPSISVVLLWACPSSGPALSTQTKARTCWVEESSLCVSCQAPEPVPMKDPQPPCTPSPPLIGPSDQPVAADLPAGFDWGHNTLSPSQVSRGTWS